MSEENTEKVEEKKNRYWCSQAQAKRKYLYHKFKRANV
jgi:hypothetical protein